MENTWNFSPKSTAANTQEAVLRLARKMQELQKQRAPQCRLGEFKKITPDNMAEVWAFLQNEPGRTTDFSYAGVLMWVDFFNYQYAIYKDTLFIKGVVENDLSKPAFSLPVGALPLSESVALLKDYCDAHSITLEFSAVPEYAMEEMRLLNPVTTEELSDWGDYLYNMEALATLAGKKMSKKRNHVHQFENHYPDWKAVPLTKDNADEAMAFMDIFDLEGDDTEMAAAERQLSRQLIDRMKMGDSVLKGLLLYADGKVCAYTIGDTKGDTLFVHVEKATRNVAGSYEMINYLFAKHIAETQPEIKFVNREDDAGDIGLRMAKESYHPCEILKKYNIVF